MGWNFNALVASALILLVAYFNWEIDVKVLYLVFPAALLLTLKLAKRSANTKLKVNSSGEKVLSALLAFPLVSILAIGYGSFFNHLYRISLVSDELVGPVVWVKGRVDDIPTISLAGKRFLFNVACLGESGAGCKSTPLRLLSVNWQDAPDLAPGDELLLPVKLKPMQSQPHSRFNALQWAKQNRISGQARVQARLPYQRQASHWSINRFRAQLSDHVMAFLDSDNPTSRLFPALIVGARSNLTDEQWRVMNLSGTTHLFAISGMHVTFFATCVYAMGLFFLRRCQSITLRWPAQNVMALIAYLVAVGYGFLAGMSVPTLRTLVMLGILLVAKLSHRHVAGMRLFITTLLCVLLADPFAGLSVGFWLSFLAVGLLIWIDQTSTVLKWVANIKTQWWISIGMIPITLYYFQVIPVMAFFANLLAIPLVGSVVVPLALLASFAMLLNHWLAQQCFDLALWLLDLCWRYLSWITQLPFSAFEQVSLPVASFMLVLIGTLLLLLPRSSKQFPVALLCVALPWFSSPEGFPEGSVKITLFGGDDQTIVVRSASKTLLIKNGELNNQLQNFLVSERVRAVDFWYAPRFAQRDQANRFSQQSELLSAENGRCPAGKNYDSVEIEFLPVTQQETFCAISVKAPHQSVLIVPNAIKQGFSQISLLGVDKIVAHAALLKSSALKQSGPRQLLIASRPPKQPLTNNLTGISIDWIYGKEAELVLN